MDRRLKTVEGDAIPCPACEDRRRVASDCRRCEGKGLVLAKASDLPKRDPPIRRIWGNPN